MVELHFHGPMVSWNRESSGHHESGMGEKAATEVDVESETEEESDGGSRLGVVVALMVLAGVALAVRRLRSSGGQRGERGEKRSVSSAQHGD